MLWADRKAVSLASYCPWRLHVSRSRHNIQVGFPPSTGWTSILAPSHVTTSSSTVVRSMAVKCQPGTVASLHDSKTEFVVVYSVTELQ